jgi:hypothetical protein
MATNISGMAVNGIPLRGFSPETPLRKDNMAPATTTAAPPHRIAHPFDTIGSSTDHLLVSDAAARMRSSGEATKADRELEQARRNARSSTPPSSPIPSTTPRAGASGLPE